MDSEIIIIIKYSRQQTPSLFSTLNTKKKKKRRALNSENKKKKKSKNPIDISQVFVLKFVFYDNFCSMINFSEHFQNVFRGLTNKA